MIRFTATIHQFQENGEKTGWTYIEIPVDVSEQLQPGTKKSFRVKGNLDDFSFAGASLLPIGGGRFILTLNATMRKNIGKRKGAMVEVRLEVDHKQLEIPDYIMECLDDEPKAKTFFEKLPKGHQRYYINWIKSAKTDLTRTKRLAQLVTALSKGQGYGEMMRANKQDQ